MSSLLYSTSSKKIVNLSKHSFSEIPIQNDRKGRRFSNINTQAVIYSNEQLEQIYTGLYLDENLHNVGTYRWLSDSSSHKYEGKFFLNNMHGYGKLFYPNDAIYEGLFYFNKKLGPGVITYNNNTQDVGLWNGNFLIRLSDKYSTSDYYKEHIPKLSGLVPSKLYLLQFKHLIPISEKFKDPAKYILTKLGAPDTVLGNKSELYSKFVRNPNSMFSNSEKLYKNFFTYEDELYTTVDVVDHFDADGNPVIAKLEVCNLVAWNNEEINLVILRHAFLNRHYEKLLDYKVKDVLCTHSRGNFLPPGPIETRSRELLFACRSTNPTLIRRLITENDLYPDVADCRGNNTVTYATLANKTNNIKVLSEFGANLNSFNDDCVTPLIFGILQYIAIKHDVTGSLWESAFMYGKAENDLPACNQQWPVPSTTSLNQSSNNSKNSSDNSQQSYDRLSVTSRFSDLQTNLGKIEHARSRIKEQERRDSFVSLLKDYMFSLECVRSKKVLNVRKTLDPSTSRLKSVEANMMDASITYLEFKIEESQKIIQTISTLLLCGANPNIGEVPFCPIITAIFGKSKELIQQLISFNANVNAKTCEYLGLLGPLHVIASLTPCVEQLEMAYVFLENGAYVDDLSNKIHWPDEQNILLGDKAPVDQLEKTPLHLICMRYDFNDDKNNYLINLALMFMQYGANLSLKYIGHTPLTLAMIRGNTVLMENLLETGLINPNEGLGYGMGVPLTMCTLNRYNKIFNNIMVKNIYAILEQFYANPLNDVPDFNGNAIEFYYAEQSLLHASKRYSLTKSNSGSLLINYAKNILLRYIESKVVQSLYQYKIILDLDSPIYNTIVKFLYFTRTCDILQILIDHDKIIVNESNIQKLLQFVDKKEAGEKNIFEKSDVKYPRFHFNNYMPELDPDDSKYKVCFECLRKTNQELMLCPKCEMVYFCSAECNGKNLKDPLTRHPCKGNFYDSEKYFSQSNRKRSTKFDHLIHKSIKLLELLSSANIDLEEFSKMASKDKKKSIMKLKNKKREDRKLSAAAKKKRDEESEAGKKASKLKEKKGKDGKKFSISAEETGDKSGKAVKADKPSTLDTAKKSSSKEDAAKEGAAKEGAAKEDAAKEDAAKGKTDSKSGKSSAGEEEDEEEKLKRAEGNRLKSVKKVESMLLKSSQLELDEVTSADDDARLKKKGKDQRRRSKKQKSVKTKSVTFSNKLSKKSRESSRSRSSKKAKSSRTSTDFGENRYDKVNLNLKKNVLKGASSAKEGLSIFIGSKKPIIDMEKRNMYLKLRAQMLEKDRERNARKTTTTLSECFTEKLRMGKNCTEELLQIARRRFPSLTKDFKELDMKFWQLFSPYCIFQNGQLYYNFNEEANDVYYKMTYSTV